ncbi:hypothetical protein HY29_13305 [Hyphomonas beringensis]|uniref:HTH tetR-type domain-containing protein n=1 Tax=Hyphomonas beringensis TaxID=1280946 RepID=A0A062UF88_9PROT|nr:TetR/AcrR family transcriptional regulator [Hyphomonas beringensis]KCZ54770.1 hypothetical protein HY29_13305 [Hyphomonas beringensis]
MSDSQTILSPSVDPTSSALTSEERILAAANSEYNQTGSLPLSLGAIAERAQLSRSLIYAHFPDQYALINALLEGHISLLQDEAAHTLLQGNSLEDTGTALADLLLEHYLTAGLLLAEAPQDDFCRGHLSLKVRKFYRNCIMTLAQKAVAEFGLVQRQARATVLMLSALPEQAARLSTTQQVPSETTRATQKRIIRLTVDTLRS